jgi:hypothetical protein
MRAKVQDPTKNSTFLVTKTRLFLKGYDQNKIGLLFLDYFSDAKTTFGMVGIFFLRLILKLTACVGYFDIIFFCFVLPVSVKIRRVVW